MKNNPYSPFQGFHDIRFIQSEEEPASKSESSDDSAEDQEAEPHDCQFMDPMLLPRSITLCIRDSFIKKNIDSYAKDLKKASEALEIGILNGQKAFAEIGPLTFEHENKDEALKYKLDVEMVELKDDNPPDAKEKQSDVQEKVFEMEDVDPDAYIAKMKSLETAGKPVEKNSDGSFVIPKFELNQVLKIKRKQVEFKNITFTNENDANAEVITNSAEYQMPTFLMRKGIRVTWDKETSALKSFCQDPEYESFINDEQIVKNFELISESNQKRIENEQVIDFRVPLVNQVFDKVTEKFSALQAGLDCKYMDKFNNLFVPIVHPVAGFGNVKLEVRDLDQLTNMDANMPLNWFDIRYKITNETKLEPTPYIKDLCATIPGENLSNIRQKEEV